MYNRLINIDHNMTDSIMLFGPRGTGKTYWLKQQFPNNLFFDLLHSETYLELSANPSLLENRIPNAYDGWIILDEIQKIPALLNEVHRLIEHKKLRFILTGSSARSLRRKGVNLLAGRALTYHMHPLTAQELSDDFDLHYALQYGTLPKAYQTKKPTNYLKSYVKTYLKEEVQQEALTRNLNLFTRFLTVASFTQGEVLNYTNIAREIGSNRQTVTNFFEILEDILIASRIPIFNKRAKRDLIAQPKFYYFDTGVFRVIRPRGPLDSDEELSGASLETLFLQQARAINDYLELNYEIYYWRTHYQHEVDFVFYGPHGLLAFEIKRKQQLTSKDFRGIKLFKNDYPMASCYVIYGGHRKYFEQNIQVIPFEETILNLQQLLSAP
ncbi:MAG: ATP-binding protein [Gammaproteobacteria bacterium]|nr:ATP-binding protein [Gammaproteobacteria bacterium]